MIRSLCRQRGFIYLSTGANGTGKTLFTLLDVRKLQQETNRPVFYSGFTPKQPIHDFGWQEFEPEKWQDLPDGSICIIDECQKVMPTRSTGKPPDWIGAIAEVHRKRGFDFFLITQHPLNFDSFIRRTIASPGWHRHFKASVLGDSSNELRWTSVVDQPQKANSGDSGDVTSRGFPKEVYAWYTSTSLNTAKKGIPLKVWGAILGGIVAIGMVGMVVYKLTAPTMAPVVAVAKPAASTSVMPSMPDRATQRRAESEHLTVGEYLDQRKPRIADFAHTAPAYDGVTQPTEAPYPAACVEMGKACKCYTQQATLLQVSASACLQIVRHGFFMDWAPNRGSQGSSQVLPTGQPSAPLQHAPAAPVARSVPVPDVPKSDPSQISQSDVSTALRLKNPQHSGLPHVGSW